VIAELEMVARTGPGIEAAGSYERLCHGTREATDTGLTGSRKWSTHEAERRTDRWWQMDS
jgi:hypothetical protein